MKTFVKIFVLQGFLLLLLNCSTGIESQEYRKAYDAYSEGRYQTAVTFLDSAINLFPDLSEAYLLRAKANYKMGAKSLVFGDLNKSIELNNNFSAYHTRGKIYLEMNDYVNAKSDLRNAYELNPGNSDLLFDLGYLESTIGEHQLALEYYLQSLELNRKNPAAYVNVGNLYAIMGNSHLAVDYYSRALVLDNTNSMAYFNRANEKVLIGDLPGSIEDYESSLFFDPNNLNTHFITAELKSKLNDLKGAIYHYSRIIEIDSTNAKAYHLRALTEISLNNKTNACNDFVKAGDLGYFDSYEMIKKYCDNKQIQKKKVNNKSKR